MPIRNETGPHTAAPYPNWKNWEITDAALSDQGVFEEEFRELRDFLVYIDTRVDPHGTFGEQIEAAITGGKTQHMVLVGAGALDEFGERQGDDAWDFQVFVVPIGLGPEPAEDQEA